MFKKTTKILAILAALSTTVHAGEIKLNIPVAAHHTGSRHDGGKWNEFFLDDAAFGASYAHDSGLGFSVNQSINSYGKNRSFYVTADYLPNVWQDGILKLNLGGHVGFATGYKEINEHGRIPFVGLGAELEVANVGFEVIATPPYQEAPATFILLAKFKLWDSDNK